VRPRGDAIHQSLDALRLHIEEKYMRQFDWSDAMPSDIRSIYRGGRRMRWKRLTAGQ
jgi:hypothetical protein